MSRHLEVIILRDPSTPSLNPLDSDSIWNAVYVEQLMGTLVRMSPSGRYEGYLAESWSYSNDFKTWTFLLRPNLRCEDGTPINARTTVQSLNRIIRLVNKNSPLPLIDRLKGFHEIKNDKDIPGIRSVDELEVTLEFDRPVGTGLLEYLGLPYLGFYCASNFDSNGSWKNDHKMISSAAYRIDDWSGDGPMSLRLRQDWPLKSAGAPEFVRIRSEAIPASGAPTTSGFIISAGALKNEIPEGYLAVRLLPTIFYGAMVSPMRNEWLKQADHRTLIARAIHQAQNEIGLDIEGAFHAKTLYPHMSVDLHQEKIASIKPSSLPDKPLLILASGKKSSMTTYQVSVIERALQSLEVPYKIQIIENMQKDLMNTVRDPMNYDIRPIGVDIGGGIENQLIKFMFCSKLGVSFPDPSGRICKLVEEFEHRYGDDTPQDAMKEYIQRFDSIVKEDASVVPMAKSGIVWSLSQNISPHSVSPTMGIPYFDLFEFQ